MKNHFYFKANLVYIFVFLNIWDFAVNRVIFNGMIIGAIMFGPAVLLWLVGSFRAVALVTLVSIVEFMAMLVFVGEGFELSGAALSLKSAFFVPYLAWAGINSYWGLRAYYAMKEGRIK